MKNIDSLVLLDRIMHGEEFEFVQNPTEDDPTWLVRPIGYQHSGGEEQ